MGAAENSDREEFPGIGVACDKPFGGGDLEDGMHSRPGAR